MVSFLVILKRAYRFPSEVGLGKYLASNLGDHRSKSYHVQDSGSVYIWTFSSCNSCRFQGSAHPELQGIGRWGSAICLKFGF